MKNFEIIKDLPVLPLYEEFKNMIESKKVNWTIHRQICINSIPGLTYDTGLGAASLEYDWNNYKTLPDGTLQVPKRETILTEEDFTAICDVFKGTLFEEVYNALNEKYILGRVRLMEAKPKTCLTWHKDTSKRLHFPLTTHEGCFMVIDDEVQHIPLDTWCLTRTTQPHTAFNGSKEVRIHLVAVILGER
jgi:hypothetical protein